MQSYHCVLVHHPCNGNCYSKKLEHQERLEVLKHTLITSHYQLLKQDILLKQSASFSSFKAVRAASHLIKFLPHISVSFPGTALTQMNV